VNEKRQRTIFSAIHPLAAYLLAASLAILAVVLRLDLETYVSGVQFIIFFPAVLLSAFLLGTGPGLVTAILCGFGSWYFIVPPRNSWDIADPTQMHALAIYLVVAPLGAAAVGAMRDAITHQREAEAKQQLLIAELQHRTRNLLAVVRSISDQTLRSSSSLANFAQRFDSRLGALGRVQSLLSRGDESIDLQELVCNELIAHNAEPDGERVRVSGPKVTLSPQAVQVFALAVHELATNAVKHGALAQEDGRLAVVWTLHGADYRPQVVIYWAESGVCLPETASQNRGFGRQLIERALPYDLGAKTKMDFMPDGLHCRIELPLDSQA